MKAPASRLRSVKAVKRSPARQVGVTNRRRTSARFFPPLTGGKNGSPSTNGAIGAPSTNGAIGGPSTNGDIGGPSTNGAIGGPSTNGANGRDRQGRFGKGNAGGPGNPFARQVAALRGALCQAITDQDVQALARTLLDKAKQGDLAAAKLLWLYTIGKPGSVVDPDTLDLHEWQIFRQSPTDGTQLQAVLSSLPVQLACEILRAAMPALKRAKEAKLAQRLDRRQARKHRGS